MIVLLVASIIVRIVLLRYYKNVKTETLRVWQSYFIGASFFSGLIWGTIGILFEIYGQHMHSFQAFILGGMAAGGVVTNSSIRWNYSAYVSAMLIPSIIYYFLEGTSEHIWMALMYILFMVIMIGSSINFRQTQVEKLILLFQSKKTNDELSFAQTQLQTLGSDMSEAQKIAHVGNWEWNIENNTLYWSDEIYRIFGLSPQAFEATYEAFLNTVHPEDRELLQTAVEKTLANNFPYSIQHRIVLPDGSIRIVHEKGQVYKNSDGINQKMIGTVQDITEQTNLIKMLEANKTIIENSTNEIFIFDAFSLYFTYLNQKALHNIGYTMEEMVHLTPVDIKPEYTHEQFTDLIKPLINQEIHDMQFETIHQRKDGSQYHVEIRLQLLEIENSFKFVVFAQDITERYMEQQRLKESERKFNNISENSLMGVFIYKERYVYVNDAFAKMVGYTPEELYEKEPWQIMESSFQEIIKKTAIHRLKGEHFSKAYHDIKLVTKTGRIKTMRASTETIEYQGEYAGMGTIIDITDIIETKEQLKIMAQAIEQSDDLIKIVDTAGKIIFANQAVVNHSGYSHVELIGAHTRMFKSGEHPVEFYANLWESLKSGKTFRERFKNRKKDGTLFYEDQTITPVFDQDHLLKYFITTGKDVTDRIMLVNALKESEENFRNIFNNSSDGIVIHDLNGVMLEVNRIKCERLGYTREELIGQHLSMIDTPKFADMIPIRTQELMETGHTMFEGEHITKNKMVIPVEIHATLIEYKHKPAVISVIRDISERKKSEQALKDAEELYRKMFDLSPIGILLIDPETAMPVQFNETAHRQLGYTREEFTTLHVSKYEAVETEQETKERIEALKSGSLQIFETKHRKKDGSFIDVIVSVQMLILQSKPYLFTLFQDVTEAKRYERKLQDAKKEAESASIAKSNFLANMSHEIRTPMNAIMGLIQLTQTMELPHEARGYLTKVENASSLLLHIINDILDLSKIEANKMEIVHSAFSLSSVIEQLAALFGPKADEKEIELILDIAPDTPVKIIGDSLRLSQILNNLISNAIKFTHEGEVILAVRVLNTFGKHVELSFEIKDTGIGIDLADQHKLFEAFSQVDGSITRQYGGTGLGLSISKKLAEMMEGTLSFTSTKGVGSIFTVNLSFAVDGNEHFSDLISHKPHKLNVLVVDDQPTARAVVQEMLKSWKCHVEEASDGEEALKKIKRRLEDSHPYDVILMDWNMPRLNGTATAKAIRKLEQETNLINAHIIMMLTAYSREIVLKELDASTKIDSFLHKPITISALHDALMEQGLHEKLLSNHLTATNLVTTALPIQGARVLLVEDNDMNIFVETNFLKTMGLTYMTVTDGLQAVQILENEQFDAILMDYQMPVMDGIEATKILRKRGEKTPIIAMTAAVMDNDRIKCLEAGMDDFIPKPIDINQMASVLTKWIPHRTLAKDTISVIVNDPEQGSLIDSIEGVDQIQGMKNSSGNQTLYHSLLIQFLHQYENGCHPLHELIKAEHWDEAKRWVHSLKGTSATIGAADLSRLALEYEHKLSESLVLPDEELCETLEGLILELIKLELIATDISTSGNTQKSLENLERIADILHQNQVCDTQLLDETGPGFHQKNDKLLWNRIRGHIEAFEYDEALQKIDELASHIKDAHARHES